MASYKKDKQIDKELTNTNKVEKSKISGDGFEKETHHRATEKDPRSGVSNPTSEEILEDPKDVSLRKARKNNKF